MGIFRTLRKRVKAIFMGLSGIVPSLLASLTRMPRSFLGLYFQAPATELSILKVNILPVKSIYSFYC